MLKFQLAILTDSVKLQLEVLPEMFSFLPGRLIDHKIWCGILPLTVGIYSSGANEI